MFSEPLLSVPRGMSGEWVPMLTGTAHGRPAGSLSRSAILSSGGAPGVQRLLGAFEPHMSPHMGTTAGLSTTRASTTIFRRESASESASSDRRSAAGLIQDPHFTSQNTAASQSSAGPSSAGPRSSAPFENSAGSLGNAGPASSAGPRSSAGPASSAGPLNGADPLQAAYRASFSDSTTSRSRLLAGPGPPSDGSAGRFSASARDVSPFQRQHSVVRRSRHVSPSEPLIVLDDAHRPDAVMHREQSPEVPEVRLDRVWERTPVRCRRRSRRRVSSRRRHRRRRDSSESSDSDDGRRPRAREFTALTTVPRHERERDPERGSVSSQRFATWDMLHRGSVAFLPH